MSQPYPDIGTPTGGCGVISIVAAPASSAGQAVAAKSRTHRVVAIQYRRGVRGSLMKRAPVSDASDRAVETFQTRGMGWQHSPSVDDQLQVRVVHAMCMLAALRSAPGPPQIPGDAITRFLK